MFIGPFGDRKLTYADYTASGKSVEAIEAFVHDVVLPLYGNTHTTTSVTGHQMTLLRHEARLLIKRLVNANFAHGNDKDVLLFHGSGVTGCINAAVAMLGLDGKQPAGQRAAVVFVGPYGEPRESHDSFPSQLDVQSTTPIYCHGVRAPFVALSPLAPPLAAPLILQTWSSNCSARQALVPQ